MKNHLENTANNITKRQEKNQLFSLWFYNVSYTKSKNILRLDRDINELCNSNLKRNLTDKNVDYVNQPKSKKLIMDLLAVVSKFLCKAV